MGKANDKNYI